MLSTCKAILLSIALGLAVAGAPAPASAQSLDTGGCDEENASDKDAGSFRKVEKSVGYEWEKLKQDFLPRIHDSLKGAPF